MPSTFTLLLDSTTTTAPPDEPSSAALVELLAELEIKITDAPATMQERRLPATNTWE